MMGSVFRQLRAGRPGFAARKLAMRACEAASPDARVTGAVLQAIEGDRFVFAVILDPGHIHRGMSPHRIFAVSRTLKSAHEVDGEEGSKYRLRGIK